MDRSAATLSEDSSANVFSRTDFRHIPGHLFGHYFYVSGRSAFRSEEESVREAACALAAALGRQYSVPTLRDALGDPDADVRPAGMLGDRSLAHCPVQQMRHPVTAAVAGRAMIELFPHSVYEGDLWSLEEEILGPALAPLTEDHDEVLPVFSASSRWVVGQDA